MPVDSHEELWSGLPVSILHKQKRLTGWRTPSDERPEESAHAAGDEDDGPEERVHLLETDTQTELRRFLDSRGRDVNTVLLAVYHVVLQWYLDDVESLIACYLLSPCVADAAPGGRRTATLRPSYVYAEDDDTVEGLLNDVAHQLRTGPTLDVDPCDVSAWGTKSTPVFFYAGVDGLCAPESGLSTSLGALRFPDHRAIVAAGADAARAEVRTVFPSAVSRAIGIDTFQRRYDTALSALLAGGCSRVGELRRQLGDAVDAPYRQLEEMQQRVIALWAKVLGLAADGLTERSNYYEVGGTSLNAFKLVNRVRVEFQRDISIWDIVENPTIHEFSRVLLKT